MAFDLCKVLGVEENEEFFLNGYKYKIRENQMYSAENPLGVMWAKCEYSLNLLAKAEIKRQPFVPKFEQKYWLPAISNIGGVISMCTINSQTGYDLIAIKHNLAFRTEEDCDKLGVPLMEQWKKELGW